MHARKLCIIHASNTKRVPSCEATHYRVEPAQVDVCPPEIRVEPAQVDGVSRIFELSQLKLNLEARLEACASFECDVFELSQLKLNLEARRNSLNCPYFRSNTRQSPRKTMFSGENRACSTGWDSSRFLWKKMGESPK